MRLLPTHSILLEENTYENLVFFSIIVQWILSLIQFHPSIGLICYTWYLSIYMFYHSIRTEVHSLDYLVREIYTIEYICFMHISNLIYILSANLKTKAINVNVRCCLCCTIHSIRIFIVRHYIVVPVATEIVRQTNKGPFV
jgi:hypothetical protein